MIQRISWKPLFILLTLLAYLPFLNLRIIPTAGDEKVYVQQALEMKDAGTLFFHKLFGEGNYFKGPLHYLFILLGEAIFGLRLMAIRYMNLIAILITGLALGSLVERHFYSNRKNELALWASLACAFSAGSLGHIFASQMEIELLAAYTLALLFLDKSEDPKNELYFWLTAGIAGWIKSPAHSALLGASYLLYFFSLRVFSDDRTALRRLKSPQSWFFCFMGIFVCISGYLPSILGDWDSFYSTYLQRESFGKSGGNGGPTWQAWFPLFFYYLFPWNWLALGTYFYWLRKCFSLPETLAFWRKKEARPFLLSISIVLPTLIFFWIHPYRGENYTYPAQGALVFALALTVAEIPSTIWMRLVGLMTALQILIPAVFFVWLVNFSPPEWLPQQSILVILGLALPAFILILRGLLITRGLNLISASLGVFCFVLSTHLILFWIGDREMVGLRNHLAQNALSSQKQDWCYLNLDRNIWNEAGYLSFSIGKRIHVCHLKSQAIQQLLEGGTVIVSREELWKDLAESPELKAQSFEVARWTRWGRHAHIGSGRARHPLLEVRETGKWSILEREFLLVRVSMRPHARVFVKKPHSW